MNTCIIRTYATLGKFPELDIAKIAMIPNIIDTLESINESPGEIHYVCPHFNGVFSKEFNLAMYRYGVKNNIEDSLNLIHSFGIIGWVLIDSGKIFLPSDNLSDILKEIESSHEACSFYRSLWISDMMTKIKLHNSMV